MANASSNVNAPTWDALSGHYQLRPGRQPSLLGHRPVLGADRLARLLQGQRGEQVCRTLSNVFTLCAHAHRHTAELALAAAQAPANAVLVAAAPAALYVETARDHLRSIALDWPQRLSEPMPAGPSLDWLRDCPLRLATTQPIMDNATAWETLAALRVWLERSVLRQPVADWLVSARNPDALAQWCQAQAARLVPARCLAQWYPLAHALTPPMRGLDVLDADAATQTVQLQPLAQALEFTPDFAQRPTWQGACFETGPWTRLRHRSTARQHSAWTRLSARWMELMELAAATAPTPAQGSAPWLVSGALALGDGRALAWCEMARGLLLHWVRLDRDDAVQDYRVLAPTEWNFHPQGALARTVAALPIGDTAAARMLAAAFDPCVACTIESSPPRETPGG